MTGFVVLVLLLAAACASWLLWDLRVVPSGDADGGRLGSISVVIPARDEELTLPTLLASLRALTIEVAEIVVVDDDSRDGTQRVARAGGALVFSASQRPAGWTGKAWACHVGAREASGDLLLFLDADTVLAPDALGGLLELHQRHGGLVSVQPYHRVVRAYEQFSSYFNVVSLMASAAFGPGPSRRPMAFGPCLLTSRTDYRRSGGHAAVAGEILDDVQLAAAYHRAGLPVRCAVGGGRVWMRSYPGGLRQLSDGWAKNVASGATTAAPAPMLGSVWWVCAHHAVAVGLLLALVEAVTGSDLPLTYGQPVMWAAAWVVFAWQLRWILRQVGSFAWWTWMFFPLPLLVFDLIFARSAALTLIRRSVTWRGRTVDLDRSGSARGGR